MAEHRRFRILVVAGALCASLAAAFLAMPTSSGPLGPRSILDHRDLSEVLSLRHLEPKTVAAYSVKFERSQFEAALLKATSLRSPAIRDPFPGSKQEAPARVAVLRVLMPGGTEHKSAPQSDSMSRAFAARRTAGTSRLVASADFGTRRPASPSTPLLL